MKKIEEVLQTFLFPIATRLERQKHLQSVKDGMIAIVPIIIVGSFCLVPTGIANLVGGGVAEFVAKYADVFSFPTYFTTNIMSLFSAFFIADSLAKRYDMRSPLIGMTAVLVHLMLCVSITETGWSVTYLAAEGLFVSIIVGLVVPEVTRLMKKYNMVIKMPESVPPMVADSFFNLLPLAVNIIIATAVAIGCREFAGTTFPELIIHLLAPAITSMDSLGAVLIVVFLTQLLWFFGLHGAAVTSSVWAAFAIANGAANAAAVAAGEPATHIFTYGFYYGFLQVSGSGITFMLVVMMCFSKAKSLKSIGRISMVPTLFGINEPVIFGTPIIMNPYMFIPFIFGPCVVAAICYLAMQFGLVGLPLWEAPGFLPPGFQAFLLTLDWKAFALVIGCVLLMGVIYYPFFKAMEADELKKEELAEENN